MSLVLLCPLDGLPLKAAFALAPISKGDVDGDFKRDPTQHHHMIYAGEEATCASGHTWRWADFDLVMTLVDPDARAVR